MSVRGVLERADEIPAELQRVGRAEDDVLCFRLADAGATFSLRPSELVEALWWPGSGCVGGGELRIVMRGAELRIADPRSGRQG